MAYTSATNSTTLTSTGGNTATLTASWTEDSYTVSTNKSKITVTASIYQKTGSYSQHSAPMLYVDWYDSVSQKWENKASLNVTAINRYETKSATATFEVSHETDGTLEGQARARWVYSGSSAWPVQSGSITTASTSLTTIPRYFTTMSISLGTRTDEHELPISWSTSETCDYVDYSFDNKTWQGGVSVNGTSGSIVIKKLSAGTSYTPYIRCRRKDSQLTTTKNGTWSTYPYPTLTKANGSAEYSEYEIGSGAVSFVLNNPLNRNCTVYMVAKGKTQYTKTITTSTGTASISPSAVDLYNTIPESSSGTTSYYCTYSYTDPKDNVSKTFTSPVITGIYRCNDDDCTPDITNLNLRYVDLNAAVTAVLGGNNQYLVQNQSELGIAFNAATPMNGAYIKEYIILINNLRNGESLTSAPDGYVNRGKIAYNKDIKLSLIVADSRGYFITSKNIDVKILPWSKPAIAISAERENNFNTTTSISSNIVSFTKLKIGGNEPDYNLSYRSLVLNYCEGSSYDESKVLGGESGIPITIDENGKTVPVTLELDQSKNYIFKAKLSDAFDSSEAYALVNRGIPIMMVDGKQLGVGVNCFPEGKGLYVDGDIYSKGAKTQLKSYYFIDATELDSTQFYPVIFERTQDMIDCEIHSESGSGSKPYNQNVIHFQMISQGWSDTPPCFSVLQYNVYSATEITIGCIGRGITIGDNCVWIRGGLSYNCCCNIKPVLYKTNYNDPKYTENKEIFSVGTNYYGGSNTNVEILFTPQSTIKKGAYFSNLTLSNSDFLDKIYPKGSVYMSTQNISPASFLGGSWTPLKDRFLVGAGSSYAVRATGGHTELQAHTHPIPQLSGSTNETGAHKHSIPASYSAKLSGTGGSFTGSASDPYNENTGSNGAHSHTVTVSASTTGSTGSGNGKNLPPYFAVYMWERTE